ncbi:hypothetical protein PFISCL1PPCAC_21387, partial [Pristionchus fissidentatus]
GLGAGSAGAAARRVRLIRIVTTVVLRIAHPSFGNASGRGSTAELSDVVAFPDATLLFVLVRIISAVVLPV